MHSGADLFSFVGCCDFELEPLSFALDDLGVGTNLMAWRSGGEMLDFDRHANRALASVEEGPNRVHRRKLHHADHYARSHDTRQCGVEQTCKVVFADRDGVTSFGFYWYVTHGRTLDCSGVGLAPQAKHIELLDCPLDSII